MDWILFTSVAISFRAVLGIMTKALSNKLKVSAYTQAFLMLFAALIISAVLVPFLGGFSLKEAGMLPVLLVVVSQGVGNALYFAALRNLTNGTAQITFSSVILFNTGFALLFMDLSLSLLNIFGIVLLLLSIVSVTTGKIEIDRRGVLIMLLAACLFAIFQLSSAELSSQISAGTYLVMSYGGASGVIFALKSRQIIRELNQLKNDTQFLRISFLTALPSVGNFLFAYFAYRTAPEPARVAMLLTAQVVLTVILSYFFLREKDHVWRKALAAVLVVCSAFLIKG